MSAYIKDGNAERLAIVDDIGTAITLTGQLAFLGLFFFSFHMYLILTILPSDYNGIQSPKIVK